MTFLPQGRALAHGVCDRRAEVLGHVQRTGEQSRLGRACVHAMLAHERNELSEEVASFVDHPQLRLRDSKRRQSRDKTLGLLTLSSQLEHAFMVGKRAVVVPSREADLSPRGARSLLLGVRRTGFTLGDERVDALQCDVPAPAHEGHEDQICSHETDIRAVTEARCESQGLRVELLAAPQVSGDGRLHAEVVHRAGRDRGVDPSPSARARSMSSIPDGSSM